MSWRFYDYRCTDCGDVQESFEDRTDPPQSIPCQSCAGGSVLTLSAPKLLTDWNGSVNRAKSEERPNAGILDTRALADGMPIKDWKAKRSKMWLDKDLAENKLKAG